MKKTKWFKGDEIPEKVGVYQTAESRSEIKEDARHLGYQYWDGAQWGMWDTFPQAARDIGEFKTSLQVAFWRGLASDPSQSKEGK